MAISQHLVELMGGEIEVESEVGKGSIFTFELMLPVVRSTRSSSSPIHTEIVGYQGARKKILVVDDKPEMRLVLQNMLAPLGFEVITGENGQEAVAAVTTGCIQELGGGSSE